MEVIERELGSDTTHFLTDILNGTADSIIVVDPSGTIVFANYPLELLFGYKVEEILGKNLNVFLPAGLKVAHTEHFSRYFTAPDTRPMRKTGELLGVTKSGKKISLDISLSPIKFNDRAYAIACIRDITHRIKELKKLQKSYLALQEAEMAKSQFLAQVGHEFRTPLNAIIGFSELILQEIRGPIGNRAYLQDTKHVIDASRHLLDLIEKVLDVSKLELGISTTEPVTFTLRYLIEDVVDLLSPLANRRRIQIGKSDIDLDVSVNSDRVHLRQILTNLLSNAVKYNRLGGRIEIEAFDADDIFVELHIRDTGYGMLPEDVAQALQVFGRPLKQRGLDNDGLGIGLTIVQRLSELNGIKFTLESDFGEGTTAILRIPKG